MQSLVSIVIINYNTKHLLKGCIDSLLAQNYKNIEIFLIDNNSPDQSCEYAIKEYSKNGTRHSSHGHPHSPENKITFVCNKDNIGYAPAGNQGINLSKGKYVMLMNPDILFAPDYLEKCVAKMEENHKIAAICGKIYKYDFQNHQKTNFIDTVGLFCYRDRRVIDDGQGLEDNGQFDQPKEVFGISGACPLYRKEALEDAKVSIKAKNGEVLSEYLDNDFFMYKEDVDISWRFHLLGWTCFFLPTAKAYHGRGTGVLKRFTTMEVAKNRTKLNAFQKHYSYKNQRLMQIKNDLWPNIGHDLPYLLWKEILMFGYMTLREPYLYKSFWLMLKQMPKMLRKRKEIMKKRRVDWKEMQKWVSGKQSQYLP